MRALIITGLFVSSFLDVFFLGLLDFLKRPIAAIPIGLALFYGVLKFFETVEKLLNEETKKEIAVWLLGIRTGVQIEPWPRTFAKIFDRVFGTKHFSISCICRSTFASLLGITIIVVVDWLLHPSTSLLWSFSAWPWSSKLLVLCCLLPNLFVDYLALLKTRWILKIMAGYPPLGRAILMGVDFVVAFAMAVAVDATGSALFMRLGRFGYSFDAFIGAFKLLPLAFSSSLIRTMLLGDANFRPIFFYPMFLTSLWVWLYVGSGVVLRGTNRLDAGFSWFKRHFDIENKPLQSIGFVAGLLFAIAYWFVIALKKPI
jgi:hypothetical protein